MKHELGAGAANAAEEGVIAESIAEIVFRLRGRTTRLNDVGLPGKRDKCALSAPRKLPARGARRHMTVVDHLPSAKLQYTLMTGSAPDEPVERKLLTEPLQSIMEAVEPLYGVDETLAFRIEHVYGMIGLTSFDYLDKQKPGVTRDLNDHEREIHVFLGDLAAGLAAAASAAIAHRNKTVST